MAAKPVPLSRAGARVQVSFEFFPPKTAEMEASLWEAATRTRAAEPRLRLCHLRRRRVDPRAHARPGRAHRM